MSGARVTLRQISIWTNFRASVTTGGVSNRGVTTRISFLENKTSSKNG